MEKMNALTLIITLVVGVILTGALLGPVVKDATQTTTTFSNEGYYEMTYDERDEVTILWEYSSPYQLKVNDVVVPIPEENFSSSMRKTVLMGDDFILRTNKGGGYPLLQFTNPTKSVYSDSSPDSPKDMTIVCSNGSYTVTAGTNTATGTYTELYTVSNDGEYVMKYTDQPAYVLGDSEFVAMGTSSLAGNTVGIKITGTYDDGADVSVWQGEDWVFSNIAVNATEVSGYNNLYKLTTITADATLDENSGSITYSYFLVPSKVTAELSQHLSPGEISLVGAIPILVIVAILMAAIGAIALRRAD